jgi:hypothetical protein
MLRFLNWSEGPGLTSTSEPSSSSSKHRNSTSDLDFESEGGTIGPQDTLIYLVFNNIDQQTL